MKGGPQGSVLRSIQTLYDAGTAGGMTDGQLLEQFLSRRDGGSEAAFAALVALHGPMVWNVCRGVLSDPNAAEDAFQATFLVLVRKASSIRRRDTLGPWLYGVARRVAVRAKAAEARRRLRLREGRGAEMQATPTPTPDPIRREQLEALHEEVDRLPEKYRAPVVLCHLEGRTHAEAARLLGCPAGTVSIRLSRARERLRARLTRRGWALPSALLGALLAPRAASAAMPNGLAKSTIDAATRVAAGKAMAAGAFPASVTRLAEGAIQTMNVTRLITTAAGVLTAGLFTAGVGLLAAREGPDGAAQGAAAPPPAPAVADPRARSMDNFKLLGLAMQNFASAHGGRLPAAAIRKDGKPLLSWRVALLPYLEQRALHNRFRLDEPWDSPHNKPLLAEMPAVYAPVVRKDKGGDAHSTHYQVIVGPGTLFDGDERTKLAEIKDSPSFTLMVVEAETPVPWTKPEDVPYDKDQPLPKLGGQFEDGAHVNFADGASLFLSKQVGPETLRALITRGGGEVLDAGNLHPDWKQTLEQLMQGVNGKSNAIKKATRTPVAYKAAQARNEIATAAEGLIALSKEARGMWKEGAANAKDVADPERRWSELMDALTGELETFAKASARADATQAATRSAWGQVARKCADCHAVFRVEDEN